jgi:hypothetical protein
VFLPVTAIADTIAILLCVATTDLPRIVGLASRAEHRRWRPGMVGDFRPSMSATICEDDVERLRLPRNWRASVRSVVLKVVGIVRIAMLAGREALIANGDANVARIH